MSEPKYAPFGSNMLSADSVSKAYDLYDETLNRRVRLAVRPKPWWLAKAIYKWILHKLLVLEYFM
jgi:hypothetical protein